MNINGSKNETDVKLIGSYGQLTSTLFELGAMFSCQVCFCFFVPAVLLCSQSPVTFR